MRVTPLGSQRAPVMTWILRGASLVGHTPCVIVRKVTLPMTPVGGTPGAPVAVTMLGLTFIFPINKGELCRCQCARL
jgi:hypothetical protein